MPADEWGGNPRQRFVTNVLSNVLILGLNMVIGIWLTPYLIKHLGVAAYGLVPLANSTTNYVSVINSSLNNAVGRYLTIDIRRGLLKTANRTFNTALGGSMALALLMLPFALGVSLLAPRIFDVPIGQERAAIGLFAAIMTTYLIGMVRSIFGVSAFTQNRFDWLNAIAASSILTRLVIIVLLFTVVVPQLWHVGLGSLLGAILAFAVAVAVWRRLTPQLSIHLADFDRSRLRDLFGTGGWMMVNQVGTLLFLQIDLIIVNLKLGAEITGRYGSVMQWSVLLRLMSGTLVGVLTPVILAQFARGDDRGMTRLSQQAIKLLGLIMALPVGLVCGLSPPLLNVWLGPEFTDLALLLCVLTGHLCINLAIRPLFSIQVALNKVKWPGIVTLLMGLLNLMLAIWWAGWGANGLGVALAGAVVLTLKNTLFTPLYGAYIQRLPWHSFLTGLIPGVLGALGIGLAGYALAQTWQVDNWLTLGSAALILTLVYAAVAYFVALNREERRFLLSFVPRLGV